MRRRQMQPCDHPHRFRWRQRSQPKQCQPHQPARALVRQPASESVRIETGIEGFTTLHDAAQAALVANEKPAAGRVACIEPPCVWLAPEKAPAAPERRAARRQQLARCRRHGDLLPVSRGGQGHPGRVRLRGGCTCVHPALVLHGRSGRRPRIAFGVAAVCWLSHRLRSSCSMVIVRINRAI